MAKAKGPTYKARGAFGEGEAIHLYAERAKPPRNSVQSPLMLDGDAVDRSFCDAIKDTPRHAARRVRNIQAKAGRIKKK